MNKPPGNPSRFVPLTERLKRLAQAFPDVIDRICSTLDRPAAVYFDYANFRSWSEKMGWHVDLHRLSQFYRSFSCPLRMRFYYGTMEGDWKSEEILKQARSHGFTVTTKPVKRIRISVDASSIGTDSPAILNGLIARPLLESLSVKQIEGLNAHLRSLNRSGIKYFEDLKCNFDVEIGTDMMLDMHADTECFLLWSCDSDFADIGRQLLQAGKKVVIFGLGGRIARELNELRPAGLVVYDVRRLKEFLCWPRELDPKFK